MIFSFIMAILSPNCSKRKNHIFGWKKEINQQSHPRWSWSSQSVLEKSPVDYQAVVAWQWPSSFWTSARKKLGISFAQVLLVFNRSTSKFDYQSTKFIPQRSLWSGTVQKSANPFAPIWPKSNHYQIYSEWHFMLNKTWADQAVDQCRQIEQPTRRAWLWVEHSRHSVMPYAW